jgi:micrococcal nuclease
VLIERKNNDTLKAAGVDSKALAGKKLRVRGWVEWRNGPMIHVTHVEQIEILPDAGAATPHTPETQPPGAIAL